MQTNSKLPLYWNFFLTAIYLLPTLFFVFSVYLFKLPESEFPMQVVILFGFYFAGTALMRRHENTWSLSLFLLMSILFGSAVQLLRAPSSLFYVVLISLQVATAFAACAYVKVYFRYPYVDRRKAIFSKAQRKNVGLAVDLIAHIRVAGTIENLSLSGARIHFDSEFDATLKQILFVDVIIPELSGLQLKCRVMGAESATLRVKFVELSNWQKDTIDSYLKKIEGPELAKELAS